MELWLNVVGFAVGVVSLIYAVFTNKQKSELERMVRDAVAQLEVELDDVTRNMKLAYVHIDTVRKYMNTLRRSSELQPNLDHIQWAQADLTTAHRMLKNARARVTSLHTSGSKGGPPVAQESG